MSFKQLRTRAKELGIKASGPGINAKTLSITIAQAEQSIVKPSSSQSPSRDASFSYTIIKTDNSKIVVETVDTTSPKVVVFTGPDIIINDKKLRRINQRLAEYSELKIVFYFNGSNFVALTDDGSTALALYQDVFEEGVSNFYAGSIAFESSTPEFSFHTIHAMLENILDIGGLVNPDSVTSIRDNIFGRIVVYEFETYL